MAITFENTLGVLPDTLQYRTQRAEVLASNIANVDTPGFQAKDLSFDHILGQQQAQLRMQQSNNRHIGLPGSDLEESVTAREVRQPSPDGNTVEIGVEQAAYMRNSMEFQTSFTFLNMKLKGLQRAINGH